MQYELAKKLGIKKEVVDLYNECEEEIGERFREIHDIAMQNLPVTENIMPVAITIGDETTQYILMNCNGNAIYSDQLKFKNIYPTTVRTDMKIFKYNGSRLPSTKFNFTTI